MSRRGSFPAIENAADKLETVYGWDVEAIRAELAAARELVEAMEVLAHWPRPSLDADGHLTNDPLAGLANVRRYARNIAAKVAAL